MSDNPDPEAPVEAQTSEKKWITSEENKAAKTIAAQLHETEKRTFATIKLLIFRMGLEFVQTVVNDALEIEAQGGLMVTDGSRRRTLGGVFFYLAKERLPPDTRNEIFPIRAYRHKTKDASSSSNSFPELIQGE